MIAGDLNPGMLTARFRPVFDHCTSTPNRPLAFDSRSVLFALLLLTCPAAFPQQHYATRLGNPATRFADPLTTVEDLRKLFASVPLKDDIDYIAKESGYTGEMQDLRQAAATGNILELSIPYRTLLPAMSTRRDGKAVLLREVLWNGKEPIPAYEFYFVSKGRRWRVVTPKPCSNFWVEDYGEVRTPRLALHCEAPATMSVLRPVKVCLTASNTGEEIESAARLVAVIPPGTEFVSATAGGRVVSDQVVWDLGALHVGAQTNVCASFKANIPGTLVLASSIRGNSSSSAETRCETRLMGVPAVLLEVIDLQDPVEVGSEQTYEIAVVNQGSLPLHKVSLRCSLEDTQQFVSGSGVSQVTGQANTVTLEPLAELKAKDKAVWRVVVKVLKPGDVRFTTELTADEIPQPVRETESTRQY